MRKEELKRHIIVILALNQVGALARIIQYSEDEASILRLSPLHLPIIRD